MNKLLKNKRGDIPVMILVIGVFAICTLAIISFSFVGNKTTKGFYESIESMEEMNSLIQKYYFYEEIDEENRDKFLNVKEGYIEVIKEIDGEKIIEIRYPLS